ncbi:MAG TPA: DUF3999 family protein [Candidatus Didemnitutus sp.]|nr:DUF3999 family protein [Candidatus Didemnitutus sp.]
MKKLRLPNPSRFLLLLALAGAVRLVGAITPTEWQHRQTLDVATPGLVKVPLPASTFDAAQPGLADLRVLDATGQETSYLLDRDVSYRDFSPVAAKAVRPKAVRVTADSESTQLLIETGTDAYLDGLILETAVPYFLKAAHVDISSDGNDWQSLGAAVPLFRHFGAEQLRISLGRRQVAFVRITLDDVHTRPAAFTGALLQPSPTTAAPPPLAPLGAEIARRDEFAGETVLMVALAGRHVPLAELTFNAKDPLFMRRVTVAVREVRGDVSSERVIGTGTIYRVALDGAPAQSQLTVALDYAPPTRELLVHVYNGDSPPLAIDSVQARQHPVNLLFMASGAGTHRLLSGNAQAVAPHYDLAAFAAEMRAANAATVTPGALEDTPDYHPRESLATAPLPDIPLAGAPLDTKEWREKRAIQIERAGVQELELDPAALAAARTDFSDLRVMRAGNQIPYVLEQPGLARSLTLTAAATPDPKQRTFSVWRVDLPHAGLPLRRLVLKSATPLFQRELRVYEKLTDANGGAYERALANGTWSRTPDPGAAETRTFELPERVQGDTLWIETDNGDNPAIALDAVSAIYPVVRLIFKTAETDSFSLACGSAKASAPRYDLSLVATKLLTSPRNPARLVVGDAAPAKHRSAGGIDGGVVFWGALGLVVVVLLVVVAKLLPKPKPGN